MSVLVTCTEIGSGGAGSTSTVLLIPIPATAVPEVAGLYSFGPSQARFAAGAGVGAFEMGHAAVATRSVSEISRACLVTGEDEVAGTSGVLEPMGVLRCSEVRGGRSHCRHRPLLEQRCFHVRTCHSPERLSTNSKCFGRHLENAHSLTTFEPKRGHLMPHGSSATFRLCDIIPVRKRCRHGYFRTLVPDAPRGAWRRSR